MKRPVVGSNGRGRLRTPTSGRIKLVLQTDGSLNNLPIFNTAVFVIKSATHVILALGYVFAFFLKPLFSYKRLPCFNHL